MADTISIIRPGHVHDGNKPANILDFKVVASYNWLDERTPTILVLGIAPVWSPPNAPPPLQRDSGPRYVDQNADRTPGSPLQTPIRAIQTMQPGFDFTTIDIITDRNPIRKLFGFVTGEMDKSIRFGVTILGSTALFTRIDATTRDNWQGFQGFRTACEQEYTRISASAEGSTSCPRVVNYDFRDKAEELMSADGIEDTLASPFVNCTKPSYSNAPASGIDAPVTIVNGGRTISHVATIELSTRIKYAKNPSQLDSRLPDLWISQTPTFIEAPYQLTRSGCKKNEGYTCFDNIELDATGNLVKRWELTNATHLQRLASVLKDVVRAAKQLGAPCIVSNEARQRHHGLGNAILKVFRAGEGEIRNLPADLQPLLGAEVKEEVKEEDSGIAPAGAKVKTEVIEEDFAILDEVVKVKRKAD